MRDVYLRFNYGGDDRFKLVSRTVRVSAPYFRHIRVANFGPDKNSEKFTHLLKEFPNLEVKNMGKHYHMNLTEDLLRSHIMDVPDGSWVIWLDSDWRLPPYYLEHMQEEIEKAENDGYNHILSYQLGHYLKNPDGSHEEFTNEVLQKYYKRWIEEPHPKSYGWPLLQKVSKKNLWIDGFYGNHCYTLHAPYKPKAIPEMYYLHVRDFSDHAYCSTMIRQSWWYIGHNQFKVEEQNNIVNAWEYDALETFKKNHRCFTANDFNEMVNDSKFKEELKKLFLKFENSKILGCQQMYRMATQYNMDLHLQTSDTDDVPCSQECCQYKCGRYIDLPI